MTLWRMWFNEMLIAIPMVLLGMLLIAHLTESRAGILDYTIGVLVGGAVGVYRGLYIALKEHHQ